MMKTLYVCGDSFFSCDDSVPGIHFSEQIASRSNLVLMSLDRQGISNSAIRLQVERAISDRANFIIFGATDCHRFEIPLHVLWSHLPKKYFDISQGLNNIEYRYYPNPSRQNVDPSFACLWSDHYSKYSSGDFDPEFLQIWKTFFSEIYDESWRDQQDRWIVESSIARLERSGIPFVVMPNDNWIPSWYDNENLLSLSLRLLSQTYPAHHAFHSTASTQNIITDTIMPKLQTIWFTG